MNTVDKARRYLDRMPPAISGQSGHDQTFRVACVLCQGFGLPPEEARPLMVEYSARCVPPWSEREIDHKLSDAVTTEDPKGRGYLLKESRRPTSEPTPPIHSSTNRSIHPIPARRYATNAHGQLPPPLPNGAAQILIAAFAQGEGVRICIARTNEDGKEVPKDAGVVLTREEWLSKLETAGGDPNRFLRSSDKNGIFISINPLQIGGSRDADVTAYRHCLLEFDEISIQEQWCLISQSRIPATAVISSGGRSLHAWVKIEAKDRPEYDERVNLLYKHFADYRPDVKNKNPSRFSRLPNCMRFDKRQELLALNTGAESFTAWQLEQDAAALGTEIQVKDLLEFNADNDTNSILGNRWLCRGGSCLIIGQSGTGKSSLEMQLAILWALERPAFGICPAKPLKSLIIQAENDLGDTAEMFQGVWRGMKLPGGEHPEVIRQVQQNLTIRKVSSHTGIQFCDLLRRVIDRDKPDLVWLDPALAYIGDDISKQSVCSQFFRNGLNPIAEATGVIWMILHHTGKPPKDPKSKSGWHSRDYSYEGLGSSDLTNWARAVMVLREFDENLFELKLPKRGRRAGAKDTIGNFTTSVWLKHADHGICWEQVDAPSEEEKEQVRAKTKYRTKPSIASDYDFDGFLQSVAGEHFTANQLVERIQKYQKCSERTAWRSILPELKKRMSYDPEHRTYSK
jgi:RecA-family ATPase